MPRNVFDQPVGEPVAGWTSRAAPPRTTMQGRLCRLEPLDPARHAGSLLAAFHAAPDARDWTYLPYERPDDDLARFETAVAERARSDDPLHHAIVLCDGDQHGEHGGGQQRAVGTAAFLRIDRTNGVIEIGHIVFTPQLQRTAAATEAIFLLMRRAFDELGYRRLEWKCDALNARSCRAAERFGFAFEGIFRQALVTKGRNRDTAWYAMTDGDWPRVRAAFERWLAADNFDAAGRQLGRLEVDARGPVA